MTPTDAELEILQLLWSSGPSSVRAINDELNKRREVGYTATLKIMQIMNDKGLVKRDTNNRSHVYEPIIMEGNTKSTLLNTFMHNTFNGSLKDMVIHALGDGTSSKEELEEIKQLIDSMQKRDLK